MPLTELSAAPAFLTLAEQESTPSSFTGLAPILRIQLDDVAVVLQPDSLDHDPSTSAQDDAQPGASTSIRRGTLWVTDDSISFLPNEPASSSSRGFQLDYPSLSLHAISRTLPPAMSSTSNSDQGCVYCQIDSSTQEGIQEDEDEGELTEMWIVPLQAQDLDALFESLSYCGSLHPSAGAEDDAGGNPFASLGAFGTGLVGQRGAQGASNGLDGANGAFEDAEEDNVARRGQEQDLTESGRATLDRLDGLLESLPINGQDSEASSSKQAKHNVTPSNTLIFANVPGEIFEHTELAGALLDLLNAYGSLFSWTPLPAFGRAIIVYEEVEGATAAKAALDRLLLPMLEEGDAGTNDVDEAHVEKAAHGVRGESILRAYYGESTPLYAPSADGEQHLPVPVTDRNFLISPPGSPPVGWEPMREDPPNTVTLADDLMRALGSLRDKGLGVRGHEPVDRSRRNSFSDASGMLAAPASPSAPSRTKAPADSSRHEPSILLEPRETTMQSTHPLAQKMTAESESASAGAPTISLPGVSVQAVDPDEDDDEGESAPRANAGFSISSVKATVESMRGPTAFPLSGTDENSISGSKITPTARPPLG